MDQPLAPNQYSILMAIMNDSKCFDTHDNCIQLSIRDVAKRIGVPRSTISDLYKVMRIEGLLNNAVDIYGVKRMMVNPAFLYWHTWHDKRFHRAMYVLGSHEEAVKWLNLCRAHWRLYDPRTGEDIGFFDTEDDLRYANSYSKNDRDKIHQRDGYEDEYSEVDGQYGPSMQDVLFLDDNGRSVVDADKEVYRIWQETGEISDAPYDRAREEDTRRKLSGSSDTGQ